MIKNPQEDFKMILDEAEKKMLNEMDEKENNGEKSDDSEGNES